MAKTKIKDNEMNPIELALSRGEDAVDEYLSNVEVDEFIYHVKNLKYRYANKAIIHSAINSLAQLLEEPIHSVKPKEEFEEDNSFNEKAEADDRDAKAEQ